MLISGLFKIGPDDVSAELTGTLGSVPVALTLLFAVSPLPSPKAGVAFQNSITPRYKTSALHTEFIFASQ
jgi:hypothetical protein